MRDREKFFCIHLITSDLREQLSRLAIAASELVLTKSVRLKDIICPNGALSFVENAPQKEKEGSSKASPLTFCSALPGLLEGVAGVRRRAGLRVADDAGFVHEEMAGSRGSRDRSAFTAKVVAGVPATVGSVKL